MQSLRQPNAKATVIAILHHHDAVSFQSFDGGIHKRLGRFPFDAAFEFRNQAAGDVQFLRKIQLSTVKKHAPGMYLTPVKKVGSASHSPSNTGSEAAIGSQEIETLVSIVEMHFERCLGRLLISSILKLDDNARADTGGRRNLPLPHV
ncbi:MULTISPECIES: hypothetical protein [unclassified Rhizobium]|uniref:hypothetical protein n=1 Tax=unclassified Rhizobium TaxID=2613769 RepID=UPI001FDA7452|nr:MULTISPECIES: hypothetical protein [unclassified Rhizobium]MBP2461415.1 hypothetical protein [Rhizobium sp. PvP014]MBP2528811.1 hypothetical protein [Rhizobium sp. PvP099]